MVGTHASCGVRGNARDAGNRRPQVALDVDRQSLDRRDVEHTAPRVFCRHSKTSRGRGTTERPPASSRCPLARTRASTRRAQWAAAVRLRRVGAPMPRRTTARRRGGRTFRAIWPVPGAWCLVRCWVPGASCWVPGASCWVLARHTSCYRRRHGCQKIRRAFRAWHTQPS